MSRKRTFEEFLAQAKMVHGDKYDYSRVNWVDSHTKIEIVCPVHGSFWQIPRHHTVSGYGCNKCAVELRARNNRETTENFIKKAKKIHGNLYDYSKTIYTKAHDEVVISCSKHGQFKQKAYCHLNGEGCPFCRNSHLEVAVKKLLDEMRIKYIFHYHCKELGRLEIDFFIPEKNIGIECQGKQHFGYGGWNQNLQALFDNDVIKYRLCKEIGLNLYYVADKKWLRDINGIYKNVCTTINDLKDLLC